MEDANTMSVKQGPYEHVRSNIVHVQISTIMKIILNKSIRNQFFTQNRAWTSLHSDCCPWSVNWRTWSCRCNSRRYSGRSLTCESQTWSLPRSAWWQKPKKKSESTVVGKCTGPRDAPRGSVSADRAAFYNRGRGRSRHTHIQKVCLSH